MLRALVALLLLANLGFLALSQGWLAPSISLGIADEREPQRLAAQIDPQSIQILAPLANSTPNPNPNCLQAGPFSAEQADAAEALLRGATAGDFAWARLPQPRPAHWALVLPRPADGDGERREIERLRGQGYAVEALTGPALLSLGRYDNETAADRALADAHSHGLSESKLLEQPAATLFVLRVSDADAALRSRLQALPVEPPVAAFAACPRPR